MKPLAAFITLNLTTCGATIPGHALAWQHLPMPCPPILSLFLHTAWAGVLFVSFLWFIKATIDPALLKP